MPRKGYRKPANEARSHLVHVRLTHAEKSHLERSVRASDVTGNADFIRRRIMGFEIKRPPSQSKVKLIQEVAALNRSLSILGNNINQLAKAANSGLPVAMRDVSQELDTLNRLLPEASHLLNKLAGKP